VALAGLLDAMLGPEVAPSRVARCNRYLAGLMDPFATWTGDLQVTRVSASAEYGQGPHYNKDGLWRARRYLRAGVRPHHHPDPRAGGLGLLPRH
jgi:hypothetical protein